MGLAAKPSRLIRVLRWSPGEAERQQLYSIEMGPDTTVLDALVDIQRGRTIPWPFATPAG
jgi:succinate dehydrogenase/fumarate reductase-like Fe-S protein